jgi:hypothetical protein
MKVIKAWGGFTDGKLHVRTIDTGFGGWGKDGFGKAHAIFKSRAAARKEYRDVRKIEIRIAVKSK